jgi:hypothetical protein
VSGLRVVGILNSQFMAGGGVVAAATSAAGEDGNAAALGRGLRAAGLFSRPRIAPLEADGGCASAGEKLGSGSPSFKRPFYRDCVDLFPTRQGAGVRFPA